MMQRTARHLSAQAVQPAAWRGSPAALRSHSIILLFLWFAACGRETPTDVGGSLLPGQALQTIEVVLEPAAYLVNDTAFSGYSAPFGAGYFLTARAFQGVLDAHTLARFEIPRAIAVTDSAGTLRTDSMPGFFRGRIVLQLDTLRSEGQLPTVLRAYRIVEEWDASTATWTHRVDSIGARLPWAQPGAGGGAVIDSAVWQAGVDSLVFPVDSLTLLAWADTSTFARGAVIVMETPGGRVRASDIVLRADARSSIRRDTVVTITARPLDRTFVFDPRLPGTLSTPIMGGNPAWRTFLRFREGFDTLSVACPEVSATCRVRLRDVDVTHAGLLLVPVVPPQGYSPVDSFRISAYTLLVSSNAPLARSPLGVEVGRTRPFVQPAQFRDPAGGSPVEVPVTFFVRALVQDTVATETPPTRYVAVLPSIEAIDFGVAAFRPSPRLRLVLTIASELQLR